MQQIFLQAYIHKDLDRCPHPAAAPHPQQISHVHAQICVPHIQHSKTRFQRTPAESTEKTGLPEAANPTDLRNQRYKGAALHTQRAHRQDNRQEVPRKTRNLHQEGPDDTQSGVPPEALRMARTNWRKLHNDQLQESA